MLKGLYRAVDEYEGFDITLNIKETEKSYVFQLIENKSRFSPARFDMMFKKSNKIYIQKMRSSHAIIEHDNGDCFVIYPYRHGIPYLFNKLQ